MTDEEQIDLDRIEAIRLTPDQYRAWHALWCKERAESRTPVNWYAHQLDYKAGLIRSASK